MTEQKNAASIDAASAPPELRFEDVYVLCPRNTKWLKITRYEALSEIGNYVTTTLTLIYCLDHSCNGWLRCYGEICITDCNYANCGRNRIAVGWQ